MIPQFLRASASQPNEARSSRAQRTVRLFAAVGFALLCVLAPARATHARPAGSTPLDSLVRAETRVRWLPGPPDSAIARAAREAEPAFLDFYADWCAPCRWMDRAVYADALLGEAAEGVSMIRVDVDRPDGRALANRLGIAQYPTLVFMGRDGKETLRWVGPLSLRDTRLNLAQAAYPSAQRAEMEARAKSAPDDAALQAGAILWYGFRGEVERARTIAAGLEKRLTDRPAAERAAVRLSLGKAEELAGRTDRALLAYRSAIAAEPDGPFAWRAWLGVSVAIERAGDIPSALDAAREARLRGPGAPFLEARVARLALGAPPLSTPPGVDEGSGAASGAGSEPR